MKKDNKQRLFEVMGKLDKTFKPLNEGQVVVKNDAGEPIGTEYQPDAFDPQDEPEYDDRPKQSHGIGNFNSIDWQMLHEQLLINTELLAARKWVDGNLSVANVGDFTDEEGMLSPDELKFLEHYDLVYVHDGYPIIDDGKYKDFNVFKAKAQEIWNKEIGTPSPYGGSEPMSEGSGGIKRMTIFVLYDKSYGYLGDLAPIDTEGRASEFYEGTADEVLRTPEFQKFAKEKNITPDQIGRIKKESEYSMNGNPLSMEYYAPSDSQELYDDRTKTFYNRFGQQLRNPEEYDRSDPEWTPFGDEGDNY